MSEPSRREFIVEAGGALAAISLVPALEDLSPFAPDEPVEIAVVGVGRQGRAILGELQKLDGARVTALCDVDPSRLESGARRASGVEGFADHRAMLERKKDLRAVFVSTPTHLHRSIVEDLLAAGKAVYCEAPIASTLEDARAIAKGARSSKSVFQSGLQARANPVYRLAWSFFRSDAGRDLVSMRAQHYRKTSWRVPAADPARERSLNWRLDPEVTLGLEGELGTNQFDVFHWFVGRYPASVRGSGAVRLHADGRKVPDTVLLDLAFPEGVRLAYAASLANSFEGAHEVFHGAQATLKLAWTAGWMFKEADAPTQGWEVYANRQRFGNEEGITLIADATKLAAQGKLKEGVGLPQPPLYYAVEAFLKSVAQGEAVVCGAEEGYRATAVGILAHRAVSTGETVEIGESVLKVD
ncbi:MAG TPA: Gfo/Idh/MocA family oxidoreductase [Planctomycetota bacterium]|jgi:predicted dehydrogenase|nr:Gfo/Idh/MocA family oxidoreductase [Planctomycetota bacterium]